jgi:hypothetical protein
MEIYLKSLKMMKNLRKLSKNIKILKIMIKPFQPRYHCDINGLVCLNEHYEDLSIVIAAWSKARKRRGVVCDCLPSCNEIDLVVVSWFLGR